LIAGGQGSDREVSIDIKHGVEAKSYDDVSDIMCVHVFFLTCYIGNTMITKCK